MKKIQHLVLFSLLTLPMIFETESVAGNSGKDTEKADGSGSGVSGGSYYQIDVTKALPDEIVIEKVIHHSAVEINLGTSPNSEVRLGAPFEMCDYRINDFHDSIPWEFLVRETIKIRKDQFISDPVTPEWKIYGRVHALDPWLEVSVKSKGVKSVEDCRSPLLYNTDAQLIRIIWVKERNRNYEHLMPEEFKRRLDLLQGEFYNQLNIAIPETFGNYAAFLRIDDATKYFYFQKIIFVKAYTPSWKAFRDEVFRNSTELLSEVEGLSEGETPESMQKFLEAFEAWVAKVDAWKIGSVQWLMEFKLKSRNALDAKMSVALYEAKEVIDQKLSLLALRAERVRRTLSKLTKGSSDQLSGSKPKKHLQIEK